MENPFYRGIMDKIKLGILSLILLAAAFMVGRYTTPAKVVTKVEEKVVEKEVVKWKTKEDKNENKNKETVVVETTYPDGTVRKETRIIDKGTIRVSFESESSKQSEKDKSSVAQSSTANENSNWHVSLLAGSGNLSYDNVMHGKSDIVYGIHAEKKILGPFFLGAFALDNKTVGLSLGGNF